MRARNLYNAGYRTVRQLALAEPDKLAQDCYLGPFNTRAIAASIIRQAK